MKTEKMKISSIIQHLRKSESGGSLVETALTLPVLVTLILGAAEFARVAYTAIEVSSAARAAVSYGAQSASTVTDSAGMTTVAGDDAPDLAGLSTTVGTAGICSNNVACTGTNPSTAPGSGPICLNTDCTTSQVETVLTVTTSASITPLVQVPGFRGPYVVTGRAVQKVLKNY
jgi:Flp pilus assembly protein TadG